jgi:hypothetical protein
MRATRNTCMQHEFACNMQAAACRYGDGVTLSVDIATAVRALSKGICVRDPGVHHGEIEKLIPRRSSECRCQQNTLN